MLFRVGMTHLLDGGGRRLTHPASPGGSVASASGGREYPVRYRTRHPAGWMGGTHAV